MNAQPHKIILLNGPPGCGKDTAARFLFESGYARKAKFAEPIKRAAKELFNIDELKFRELEKEGNQAIKDIPLRETMGLTWREALIWVAETTKLKFGNDIFGRVLAHKLSHTVTGSPATVVSDCGFIDEVKPMIDVFGQDNVVVWKIFRDGCEFTNDSRSYIECAAETINNKFELDMYKLQVIRRAKMIIDGVQTT